MSSEKHRLNISKVALAALIAAAVLLLALAGFLLGRKLSRKAGGSRVADDTDPGWNAPEYVEYVPLIENEYSRPGTPLEKINGIVVHYVGNPGTTAMQNRNYFAGLAESGATWASSHFIIGLDGEVIQAVPLDEIAYCSNERNSDTVSIECCHPGEDGKFTDATYSSLIKLLRDLVLEYGLDPDTCIIRHYDVTGKLCPLYYVEHEEEWRALISDVSSAVSESAGKTSAE